MYTVYAVYCIVYSGCIRCIRYRAGGTRSVRCIACITAYTAVIQQLLIQQVIQPQRVESPIQRVAVDFCIDVTLVTATCHLIVTSMAAPVISVDELLASADLSAYAQSFEEEGWDSLAALRAITEDELQVLMASVRMKRGHEVRLRKVLGMKLASERVFALTTRTRLRRLRQRRVLAPQSPLEAGVRVDVEVYRRERLAGEGQLATVAFELLVLVAVPAGRGRHLRDLVDPLYNVFHCECCGLTRHYLV